MVYLVCFILAIFLFLWAIVRSDYFRTNQIMLIVVTMVGNGGYYALATSTCLEKAILANNLTYLIGIFSPMLLLLNICEICRFRLPQRLVAAMYSIQMLLYLCVCTTGKYEIFYKTVQFNMDEKGVYLTKTYGPLHTVYLIMMFLYLVAGIFVSIYSSKKRNIVSFKNVDLIVFVIIAIVGTYAIQRLLHLTVELMPIVYTLGIAVIFVPITKIRKSLAKSWRNRDILFLRRNYSIWAATRPPQNYFPNLKNGNLRRRSPEAAEDLTLFCVSL